MALNIAVYVTGHGFGHATRTIEVLNRLERLEPDLKIHIRTAVPRWVFESYMTVPFDFTEVRLDAGAAEANILDVDVPGTWRMWEPILAREEQALVEEVAFLRDFHADVVFFDFTPLAPAAAHRAEVPSIGMSNFSWDFIYRDYIEEIPQFASLVDRILEYYAHTTLALELPLGHPMEAFPRRQPIPLVARRSTAIPEETRHALGLRPEESAVLVALRGSSLEALRCLSQCRGFRFLTFGEASAQPENVERLDMSWESRFRDVLAASDAVLSKPGYGVVSECIAHGKPLVHLRRRGFAEQELLVAGMDGLIPHRQIHPEDLNAESLEAALKDVTTRRHAIPDVAVNGAEVAAEAILQTVRAPERSF